MAQDFKTPEARAFHEHYGKLVDSIQESDLPVLGARLFSCQIISRETMEMVGNVTTSRAVRTSKLMLTVMAHLDVNSHKFESALDVFKEEHVYSQFYSMIKESYGKLSASSPMTQTVAPPTSAVGKYAAYLRKVYLRSKLPIRGKWPPSPCKKIIKLAAIERKVQSTEIAQLSRAESIDEYMQKNSMTPISMDDLLLEKDGTPPKTVVVQGAPGIGKSTFAWKFCRQWAKGKMKQHFDVVVLLHMRDTRVREAKELCDLFYSDSKKLSAEAVEEICQTGGQGVVFLMEGLDELPASCLADGAPLSNLFQGESLPESTILVTTRPWAAQTLTEKCGEQISRRVEILGFTKKDILKYASHAFAKDDEKAEFLQYLRSHPQLESIMHIPLNAAFVVQIYKQFKRSQQAIPQTLTQLYTALVKGLVLRYMKSKPEFSGQKLVDLENLPEPIEAHFHQLCLLAFTSFTKKTVQVTFTDSEAALYGCLDSLGLMQSSADLFIESGTEVTHSFLHFTIQEFLAAYHLSKQPEDVQQLFVETHSEDSQFHIILRFLVGLKKSTLHYLAKPPLGSGCHILRNSHVHWLYESQSPADICSYLGNAIYRNSLETESAFDLYSLSYCLCHSNCKWELDLDLSNLTSVCQSDLCYDGQIVSLGLVDATSQGIHTFFSLPRHLFSNISSLGFWNTELTNCILPDLDVLRIPALKQLSVRGAHSSRSTASFFTALCGLQLITLRCINLTSSVVLDLCKLITSPTCSPSLTLSLPRCVFEQDSLQLFISAVACSKYLAHLDLSMVSFPPTEIEMLSIALSTNTALKQLALSGCGIDGEGTEILASGLEDNHALTELDLSGNRIDKAGATALAQMLEVNTTLKMLNLRFNASMGVEGAIRLIIALDQSSTLEDLYLPSECRPIEYDSILMENIRKSKLVEFL